MKNITDKFKKNFLSRRDGQVMLLAVILLSAVLIIAGVIAGILIAFQARQANDALNSAKAIFAADAVLEWQIYKYYKDPFVPELEFSSDVTATSSAEILTTTTQVRFRGKGFSSHAVRALETIFGGNLPTLTFNCKESGQPACTIESGGFATLVWLATDAISCEASQGWSGSKPVSGEEQVQPDQTTVYTLTCFGGGGVVSADVTVNIGSSIIDI